MWSELIRIAGDDEFEEADRVCVIENKSVIRVLECSLHLLYVVSAAPDVNFWVLRVFDAETVPASLVVAFPTAMALLKILASFPNTQADVLIVELSSVKFKEINKMLSKVHIVSATLFVLPL